MSGKAAADDTTITSRQTSGLTETLEQADAPEAAEHRSGVKRQDDTLHHIVIVGGGAAGLELATGLGDKLGKHPGGRSNFKGRNLIRRIAARQCLFPRLP